jgi:prepilin-type N-terminal cleavage/methylation domain-containing protein
MKNTTIQMRNTECGMRSMSLPAPALLSFRTPHSAFRTGFTLIELLVVIAIMAILAAFTFGAVHAIHKTASVSAATAELKDIGRALEDYKGKYGTYPPSNPNMTPLVNTLYYELSGVTINNPNSPNPTYTTLDGASQITGTAYGSVFGPGITGILNCTKGGAEEGTAAKNFLAGLHANRIGIYTNSANGVIISNLITSVRGPDANYTPLGPGYVDINPFRYSYPGTNNPNSYDLWVQLDISGKTYLICNWNSTPVINSPLP